VDNRKCKKVRSKEINARYNQDRFNPRDGELVKAADHLAGFLEASAAIRNGSASPDLQDARMSLKKQYERADIAGINLGEIYADFD
jgi:putative hydrolase of HD superfamily